MAKRKKSLSSSDSSSSSSSDSDSSSSESPGHRRTKSKDERKPQERASKGNVIKSKDKVEDRRKKSPETRNTSDRKRKHSDSQNKQKTTDTKSTTHSKSEDKKRNRSPDKSRVRQRSRSRKERSKSPREDRKKNLFPIVNKGDSVTSESGKKNITETTLVSYPNLNKSLTENRTRNDDDRKRRQTSPERFKSMSSTITVTHNPESEKRPRRSPVQRAPVERSLRDRVGWDPFQGTTSSNFGDHDDRQLSGGYTDSYTRKEFGRGRGRGWGRGGGRGFRTDSRQRLGGGGGGMWSNNRNFSRSNSENLDRSGINDKKWKRDLFSDD